MTTIIEPCCAERQLPALLREQKGRAVLFQTYGDVTFDNILKSVSCMAGNDHLTLTLAAREVTAKMQRTLQRYQDRQWITTLHVLTDDLLGEAIAIEGDFGTVIIQGPIQDTAAQRGAPVLYAGQFCPAARVSDGSPVGKHPLVKLLDARLRRAATAAPAAPVVSGSPADTSSSVVGDSIADNAPSVQSAGTPSPAAPAATAVQSAGVLVSGTKKKPRTPKPKKQ